MSQRIRPVLALREALEDAEFVRKRLQLGKVAGRAASAPLWTKSSILSGW
jgi:alpha-galactosidase/6-phospho-beta-glucosidase family protein